MRIKNLGKKKFGNLDQNNEDTDDEDHNENEIVRKGKKEERRTRTYIILKFIQNVLRLKQFQIPINQEKILNQSG